MAYNHGREERKWRLWKEAEEKVLRECGIDENTLKKWHDCNYYEIGAMEHCNASAARSSVVIAREKVKVQMREALSA